ncbi:MAG: FtsX-like permease family protein [Imperialibacter sp.]|uniref:ABC transporter permease n=1 Tax=Imperialibacter sp. TaxID=2038411 RepID=UPI0032F07436
MIRNYLLIAFRNLLKQKLFSFINVFSLAVGLAASIVIYLFIQDETSFDQFHSLKENIYRLDEIQSFPGTNTQKVALSMPGMGPFMQQDFPQVKRYSRFMGNDNMLLEVGEKKIKVGMGANVDSTFLRMFDFGVVEGDRENALNEPLTMVVTEGLAMKLFERKDVMGEVVIWGDKSYKITGIMKDVPENSHLQFEVLVSMATMVRDNPGLNSAWGGNWMVTYLELNPGTNVEEMSAGFNDFLLKHGDEDILNYYKLFLQPLTDVHLGSIDIEHDYHDYRKFNGEYIGTFELVGIFILLIAGVNFTNLVTARASYRFKEVGVRKSIGAKKGQLFAQFLVESAILAFLALLMALVLDLLLIPFLNTLIGRELSLLSYLVQPAFLGGLLFITLMLGLIGGIYPALFMASFKPVSIIKGGNVKGGKSWLGNSLIVVQFGLALAMIVSTFVVLQQLSFMQNKDIGFEKDHIVQVSMNGDANRKFDLIKSDLLNQTDILGVTASGQRLGNNFHQWGFKYKSDSGVMDITPSNVNVDYDFLEVFGIKLKDGRGFSKDYAQDNGMSFIINESLAKDLNLSQPIGAKAGHGWFHNDSLGTIIGVTEDFNFNSLHYAVNTLSMVVHPEWGYQEMSVKVNGQNVDGALKELDEVWTKHVGEFPLEYTFLDAHFEELYRSDKQMSAVVTIMGVLAILIACMGLFGLAAITTERRIKEIGIRKVLGASVIDIMFGLSKSFVLLILIAFVIMTPLAWLFLGKWLENFAYHIDINPVVFIVSMVIAVAIALATISYHTLKSAKANPVDALRYE